MGGTIIKHCSNFKYDLQIGNHFEDELEDILENKKIEVKADFKTLDTGNIFVEFESRGKDSGVYTSEADYYCFIFSMQYIIFLEKEVLLEMVETIKEKRGYVRGGDNNSSKGILLPVKDITNHVDAISKEEAFKGD